MTPDQYEEEQLIIQFLTIQDALFEALQNVLNRTEELKFHEAKLSTFGFLQDYYSQRETTSRLKRLKEEADAQLKKVEENILHDLSYDGWDFIKDSDGFEMLKNLYREAQHPVKR